MSGFEIVAWVLAAGWFTMTAVLLRDARMLRPLPDPEPAGDGRTPPHVSVIVTARDEEPRVAGTVHRLLSQKRIRHEIVAVDDRSTDATGAVLDQLATSEERVRAIHVERLPEGWLGKTHACHVGAAKARGDWLLFTDADAWMAEDLVARAVEAAEREGADHLCLIPGERSLTVGAEAGLLCFCLGVLPIAARVNRDRLRAPVGVGAFNLVRAEAYRSIGGHAPLKLEIIDDAKLGLLILRGGYRSRVFHSWHELEVDWSGSLPGVLRALEKNLFAAVFFSTPLAVAAILAMLVPWTATILAALTMTPAGIAAIAGLLSLTLPAWSVARRARYRPAAALLTPLALPIGAMALARSTWTTLRQGGVRWRGTFYPLDALRRGLVK